MFRLIGWFYFLKASVKHLGNYLYKIIVFIENAYLECYTLIKLRHIN